MTPLADLLLVNGRFLTMDPDRPLAAAVAIVGERILAVSDGGDVPSARTTVDLGGRTALPGFHDAHNHMAWFGQSLLEVDLATPPITSLDDLYTAMRERAQVADPQAWVVGVGYDENKLGGHPDRDGLDDSCGGRAALVKHTSGHMCVVSSRVLHQLDLADHGRHVPGGTVVVDADGRPTGLLQERAQELVNPLILPVPTQQIVAAIERAGRRYLAEGITSVVEAGIGGGWIGRSPVEAAAYQRARDEDRLPVRVELMVAQDALHPLAAAESDNERIGLDLGLRSGLGDDWLRIGCMKIFLDGSLIGRTAAMTTDFSDQPGNRGYLTGDRNELIERIVAAHRAGWRVAAHAIGDQAIDVALDAFETAQRSLPRKDPRHRIEHFGVSRPDQLTRAASLGVVPVPQGRFVGEIGDGMAAALGDRADQAYRLASLLAAGLALPGSSDRPVVDGRPMLGIHDMVNRRTSSGHEFAVREALTVQQALYAYTAGSAYASGQEAARGSLRRGCLADVAVLDADPTAVAADQLSNIGVDLTVVGGMVRHTTGAVG